MTAAGDHLLADHERRPSWRKWHSDVTQVCRSCGREIRRGWRIMFAHSPNPYLCGDCWRDGIGTELF